MRSYLLLVPAVVALASGCVPVAEPVGALDKAEPDKNLLAKWAVTDRKGLSTIFQSEEVVIDVPAVKGNPKGLMRMTDPNGDSDLWFFAVTSGKHTYMNVITAKEGESIEDLGKEGQFAAWQKREEKRFFVFRYALDGDTLTVNAGNNDVFTKLMKDAGVSSSGGKYVQYFLTEPKWADTHFAKGGADKVYDKSNVVTLKRKK